VLSSLHTNDAPGSISRMVSAFPAEEQGTIRDQLSRTLRAVVSQRLIKTRGERGRVPVCEVLLVNAAVSNLIRTGQLQQITSVMQTSGEDGMLIAEQALAEHVTRGLLAREEALRYARDEQIFSSRMVSLE
jgi:twitching motility protein PilT